MRILQPIGKGPERKEMKSICALSFVRLHLFAQARVEGCNRFAMAETFSRVTPTPEQSEAIRIAVGANAILRAGPGAGKTTTLVNLLNKLRSLGYSCIVMSHTNASADAFNDRLGDVIAMTMHSFCRKEFQVEASFDTTFRRAMEVVADLPPLEEKDRISLLVDEAQDCNKDQFALLKMLMKKGYHVVCVGDAQQSIYEFHGAAPELFLTFGDGKAVTSFDLTENWRSTPQLVAAFNEYAAYNFLKPLRQRCTRTDAAGPSPRFVCFDGKDEMYEEISRLHRNSPMLTAVLVMRNVSLDESHVRLFERGVPAITFSSERSDEFRRVPQDLQCADVLQLLTIWGGKGQEFPRVIVLGGEDQGRFESSERARLLFVAMTRAVNELHVFSTAGASSARPFSRFLEPLLPEELRRGRLEASTEPSCTSYLQVKKVSEAFGEDILRSVFSSRDAALLFADRVLEVGHVVKPPNRQLTRLGLEVTYGVVMEEKARESLMRRCSSEAARGAVDAVERVHIPPEHPQWSEFLRLRKSFKEHLNWKPSSAVRVVFLKRLEGLPDRLSSEKPALRKACEAFLDFLVARYRESTTKGQKILLAAKKVCESPLSTYRDLLWIVRDRWHLDHPVFAPARALLISTLKATRDVEASADSDEFRGSSSLACLGFALKRRTGDAYAEDYAVLRALTHLSPPSPWPKGLQLSGADLEVPACDSLSLRHQGETLFEAGYNTVKEKKFVKQPLGEFTLQGEPDIQGDDFVIEIKHVAEMTPAHVCQALLYAALTKARRAILWDTRRGRHYEYLLTEKDHRFLLQAVQERYSRQKQTAPGTSPLDSTADGQPQVPASKRLRSE